MQDVVERWFFAWLKRHQFLHPSRSWVAHDDSRAMDFYAGWVDAFGRMRVTEDEARDASADLQSRDPGYPSKHLKAVMDSVRDSRRGVAVSHASDPNPMPPPVPEEIKSKCWDCPECSGTGWANRWAHWFTMPRPMKLDFFCRCYAGRWRKSNDVELLKGDRMRKHDDLQAVPDLWNLELSHWTWDEWPCGHDMVIDADCEGRWRYILPGEPIPEAIDPAALVRSLAGTAAVPRRVATPPPPHVAAADPILRRETGNPKG